MSCCNNKCQLYEMTFYIRDALFKLFQLKNNEDKIYKDFIGITSIKEKVEEEYDNDCIDSSKDEDYHADEAEYSDSGDSDFENNTDLKIMNLEINMVENKLDKLMDDNIDNLLKMEVGDSVSDKEAIVNFIDNLMGNICSKFNSHFNHLFVNLRLFLCPGMVNVEKVTVVKQEKYFLLPGTRPDNTWKCSIPDSALKFSNLMHGTCMCKYNVLNMKPRKAHYNSYRLHGKYFSWITEGSTPEREPEKRLPHPRKAAGAKITQF
uniref:Late expression factor 11 n=1 Tax=Strongyloides venezuelensis TaxID=75913 RepID=A0A0K0FT48_STRVS